MLNWISVPLQNLGNRLTRTESRPGSISARNVLHTVDDLEERLNQHFAEQGSSVAGKLYILNLEELRERYSERWDKVTNVVHACVQRVIARHISDADYSAAWGEAYIIVFARPSGAEAHHKCDLIRREVEEYLFGQGAGIEGVKMGSIVANLDGRLVIRNLKPLEEIDRMLTAAAVAATVPKRAAAKRGPTDAGEIRNKIHYGYTPVWNAHRKFVTCYNCLPAIEMADGTVITGEAVFPDNADDGLIADIDCQTIDWVIRTLRKLTSVKRHVHLAFPIHFSTLAQQASRERVAEICRKIPKEFRHLIFAEVVGAPPDLAEDDVLTHVFVLKPFTRAVFARLSLDRIDFAGWNPGAIFSVGVDLTDSAIPEAEILPMMERFVRYAKAKGLRTYVQGLQSMSLTTAAICAGFNHANGTAVGSMVNMPMGSYSLTLSELYQHLTPTKT